MSNRFFPNHHTYKITSRFGMRTLRGVTKMHNGIDLVARTKSGGSAVDSVTAHTGGTVIAAGYGESAGNYINIQTAPNVVMVYHHFRDKTAFRAGDTIHQGDVLGFMGSTGNSTGAHLHWGIKVDGKWVDPEPWLDADYQSVTNPKVIALELPVLKRGAKGNTVKALQALLGGLDLDGSFGPATEAAVKAWQSAHGLTPDGSVGRQTWTKLLAL